MNKSVYFHFFKTKQVAQNLCQNCVKFFYSDEICFGFICYLLVFMYLRNKKAQIGLRCTETVSGFFTKMANMQISKKHFINGY